MLRSTERDYTGVLWAERSREELAEWAHRNTVVIVPIGSIEQHGLHLPVDTDCRTVEYVARQAASTLTDAPALVAPTIPFGMSVHHMAFGGTISLCVETILALLGDVCGAITAHGFDRILILSGHGGNRDTVGAAAQQLRYTLNRQIRGLCWFDLIPETLDAVREGPCPNIGHAGEAETSAILYLAPEAVRQGKLELVEGITDHPARGTATKGERILAEAAQAVARLVREMAASPGDSGPGIARVEL